MDKMERLARTQLKSGTISRSPGSPAGRDEMPPWTKTEIATKLATNDKWLTRGLLALYARQTTEERMCESTHSHNSVGFSAFDAPILTSFAKQVLLWQEGKSRYRHPVTDKQLVLARKKLAKPRGEWGQTEFQASLKLGLPPPAVVFLLT